MPMNNAAHSQHPGHHEPDIQLATLWQAIRGSSKTLMIAAVAIAGVTYSALSLMAPRYTSEGQLEFVARRNNPFPEAGERPNGPDNTTRLDPAAINTHARALVSSDLLLKVANELKLRNRVEFNSALGSPDTWSGIQRMAGIGAPAPGETEEERVLQVVRRQVEVAAIKETRSIAIRFTSIDNKLAADFANLLADTYRTSLVSNPVEETGKVVEALTPKVDQLRKEVLDAEAAVERYRASTDQFRSGPQSSSVSDQRMAGLQDELLKSEAARNETDARWRTARELHQSGSAEVLPDVQKSALIQGLIQQRVRLERQIAESAAALLPGHPRMQQLNADVGGLKRQITSEVQKVVQSIEKDARSAAIRVEAVSRQIDALKTKVTGQTGNEARLKELESLAKSKRTELERLQKQLEDNRTVINIRQVPIEAQIIARAMASSTPTYPRKGPSTMLAMAATLILGLAFVVTKALVAPPALAAVPRQPVRYHDVPSTEPELPMPADATPPIRSPAPASQHSHQAPSTPSLTGLGSRAEAELRGLTHRLVDRADVNGGVRTLVTSETSGVYPIMEAQALAELLSRSGKQVVLVAWSLSGKAVAVARTSVRKPGITDLLLGTASFEQVIGRLPGSDVHLIQPGTAPGDTRAVLNPDRLNLTLDALDEAYDQIVVLAEQQDAKSLFEAIEGRFDAAVVAVPGGAHVSGSEDLLLGFEVTGLDIVHVPCPAQAAPRAPVKSLASARPGARRDMDPVA